MGPEIHSNILLIELFSRQDINEQELKRIYRQFCKKTHPDRIGGTGDGFIRIQKEYKEALRYLNRLNRYVNADISFNGKIDPRRALYSALLHYTAAGLHSMRMRLRPALRSRNISIVKKVIEWAEIYDPPFIRFFLEYNRMYVNSFTEWKSRKKFRHVKRLFRQGLHFFFDYQFRSKLNAGRISLSYFKDAESRLELLKPGAYRNAVLSFTRWFISELELPVLK